MKPELVISLDRVGANHIESVGQQFASLGDCIRNLSCIGVPVPPGFVITTEVYRRFMRVNDLAFFIGEEIRSIHRRDAVSLGTTALRVRQAIAQTAFPHDPGGEIIEAYELLSQHNLLRYMDVAVHSSTTIRQSLPGTAVSTNKPLSVNGPVELIDAIKDCYACMLTDIMKSHERLDPDVLQLPVSVLVQRIR